MVTRLRLMTALLVVAVACPTLRAQNKPAKRSIIEQLQIKSSLTDDEKKQLRTWIEQRVQAIVTVEGGNATAARELRSAYAKGTAEFKDTFAQAYLAVIDAAYKRAKDAPAAQLIAIANTLDKVEAYKALLKALSNQRVPVRTAAAIGLRRLRPKLAAAGDPAFSQTIQALADAAAKETSAITLGILYEAMDYTAVGRGVPSRKTIATALLHVLESRGKQYQTGKVSAAAADGPGLRLAAKLAGQYAEEEKTRLIGAAAAMLAFGVERYTGDLYKVDEKTASPVRIAMRNRFEQFIVDSEALLETLAKPAEKPGVAVAMETSTQDNKRIAMTNAMKKWAAFLKQQYQISVSVPGGAPAQP